MNEERSAMKGNNVIEDYVLQTEEQVSVDEGAEMEEGINEIGWDMSEGGIVTITERRLHTTKRSL